MTEMMTFADRQAMRAWLGAHGAMSGGIWLLLGKKGGPKTVSAAEALEEALCHGWIDGQMQSLDKLQYKKYFARRTASSQWSEKNKKLAEALMEKGLVTEAGMVAIEQAKKNGSWNAFKRRMTINDEQLEQFKGLVAPHELAHANLLAMSPSVQRTYTGFYLDAKSDKTREIRLAKIIDRLNQNLKPM